jgi:hypothetical protein
MKEVRFGELFALVIGLAMLVGVSGCDPVQAQNDLQIYQAAVGGCGACVDKCGNTPVSAAGASGCQDTPGATVTINGKVYPSYCLCSCQGDWLGNGPLSCSWNPNAHTEKLQALQDRKLDVLE